MRIGSLVELSSSGNKIRTIRRLRNQTGIVMNVLPHGAVEILWSKTGVVCLNRRDVRNVIKSRGSYLAM